MMTFDDIVKLVSDVTPDFNNHALRGFVEEQINNSPEFTALVLREGFKFVGDDIELVRYTNLTPEERVISELKSGQGGKSQRARVPLTVTHMRLIRYTVRHRDQFIDTELYMPYMYNHMLSINNKNSMVRKVILEKTFSRVQDKDVDGVSVSPIRVNMKFNRRLTFRVESFVTEAFYTHFIVTAGMFHGKTRSKVCERTILHYILAKFGFEKTLKKFGINKADVSFTTEVGADTDKFEYFAARNFKDNPTEGPGLFLRVKKILLADDQARKFVVNLLYVCHFFSLQNIDNVYVEEGSIWKVILGILILEERNPHRAYNNAETHLRSVDYFIDPLTQKRFNDFGVPIKDIYDLLVHIFEHIDSYMVNNQSQDIYNSRIDVSNGLLVETFARKIFWNLYYLAKKTNIATNDVKQALRLPSTTFKLSSTGKKDDSEQYIAPPEIIGDNYLFSGGLTKIRLNGRPEQRLHPSMLVAESIDAFVGKPIGKTGYINPYIPTSPNGAIEHPAYADEIDEIAPYLPR